MSRPIQLTSLLLISSALVAPSVVRAQSTSSPTTAAPAQSTGTTDAPPAPVEEPVDVSIPGASNDAPTDIVVTGRRQPNVVQAAPQVVSILSAADIARTGEGNIAGALGRVTGLSVVGGGFVYVRGLGDRYSLALLNGSPLPSPEPLKRVVPLDIFPTGVIASSLVQKSYSVNFPGEFGGGVINLTTRSVPKEPYLSVGFGISGDSETTGRLGYTYYGSRSDVTGFDNGTRNVPSNLAAFLASGNRISTGTVDTRPISRQLVTGRNSVLQRNTKLPPNFSGSLSGGKTFDLGGDTSLGVIAAFGYSNKWRTRDTTQQTAQDPGLTIKENDFQRVITDDRILVNGLVGLGLEFGDNKVRWTNLFIRDSLKQARLGIGTRQESGTSTRLQQDTSWFERQLLDTQIVGEFKLMPGLNLDVRGGYAKSKRESPFELSFEYSRSNAPNDLYGSYFINRLNGQQGFAEVSFSNLTEDLISGGIDLSYRLIPQVTATVGYAYSGTDRRTERRDFTFRVAGALPDGVTLLRPDLLLSPAIFAPVPAGQTLPSSLDIRLIDINEANPVFRSTLRNHAGYVQLQADITPSISLNAGVRYETARQVVTPIQVFTVPTASLANTNLKRNYWLPAATLTFQLADRMQLRLNASKTIARPQFRELIYQFFFDPDSNRQYRGNPLLTDSQLYNAEARYEWYFARDQRISGAVFYKRLNKPIETFVDSAATTSFANAPKADLYGAEIETQKYFNLDKVSDAPFWQSRRAVVVANYTYTKSKLKVGAGDTVAFFNSAATAATDYFRDGSPLTGQSDHLVNLQIGLEDTDRLSAQTLLFTYASNRVTSRGPARQPDIIERPGIQLDFVARQGIEIAGVKTELKFEARNLTGNDYEEFQQVGANRIFYNKYKVGTSVALGLSVNF